MRAAKGLRIKGWESSWLGPTMDTWTGPREPMAKKKKNSSFQSSLDICHRSPLHSTVSRVVPRCGPLSIIVYVRNNLYTIEPLYAFPGILFFSIYSSFLTRIVCEIFATGKGKREKERESLARVLQTDYRYRVMIIISRNPWERDTRTRITRGLVFLFFLSFPHLNQYQYSRSSRVSAKTITCIISRTNKEEPVSRVPGTRKGTRKGTGVGRDARQRKGERKRTIHDYNRRNEGIIILSRLATVSRSCDDLFYAAATIQVYWNLEAEGQNDSLITYAPCSWHRRRFVLLLPRYRFLNFTHVAVRWGCLHFLLLRSTACPFTVNTRSHTLTFLLPFLSPARGTPFYCFT